MDKEKILIILAILSLIGTIVLIILAIPPSWQAWNELKKSGEISSDITKILQMDPMLFWKILGVIFMFLICVGTIIWIVLMRKQIKSYNIYEKLEVTPSQINIYINSTFNTSKSRTKKRPQKKVKRRKSRHKGVVK